MKIRRSYHSNLNLVEYYIPGRKKIYHRLDGPALKFNNGEQWYRYGKPHRVGGPAIYHYNGPCHWYVNGIRHRDDGPAIVYADGHIEWWLDGEWLVTKEAWFEALTKEQKEKVLYSEHFIRS